MIHLFRPWTIRRVMIAIALMAPWIALARFPFAFGFVVTIGLIASLVAWNAWNGRYDRIAWLMCAYPLFPLLLIHLEWFMIRQKLAQRSSLRLLDGMMGFSDIGALCCFAAYVTTFVLLASGTLGKADQPRRRAARWLLCLMPPAWLALLALALWDPFRALNSFIH